ncbi:hypothetical protein KGMB02408_13760 [Bacteroides faecalis]|uniref:Uncharacterized protein n=1 Tax=Bacteroides faecalis TaxID=2447885 RepID=A0A401LSK3_9BACE|nr:hypothetical protein KGMB02408_13760 [Bacteroides faecalis]
MKSGLNNKTHDIKLYMTMNNTFTLCLEILFWFALFIVFYTYLGYGILLYALVKLKELFVKPVKRSLPTSDSDLPKVTLFITAFNEEDVVDKKNDEQPRIGLSFG